MSITLETRNKNPKGASTLFPSVSSFSLHSGSLSQIAFLPPSLSLSLSVSLSVSLADFILPVAIASKNATCYHIEELGKGNIPRVNMYSGCPEDAPCPPARKNGGEFAFKHQTESKTKEIPGEKIAAQSRKNFCREEWILTSVFWRQKLRNCRSSPFVVDGNQNPCRND